MPGTDYDSAINIHICRNGISGLAPDVPAAYENQALERMGGRGGRGWHKKI